MAKWIHRTFTDDTEIYILVWSYKDISIEQHVQFTFASPLRQGCRRWVSFEFLNGTWRALHLRAPNTCGETCFYLDRWLTSDFNYEFLLRPHGDISTCFRTGLDPDPVGLSTCPSAVRDLLMAAASTSLWPSASVLEIRSEPARSHKVRVPREVSPETWSEPTTSSATTRCDRELRTK